MPQPHQKRRPQNQRSSRPNKAQQREAQIRAEQMAADPSAEALGIEDAAPEAEPVLTPEPERAVLAPDASATPATATRGASRRSEARGRTNRRATIAPATPAITREQEYQFIRADLRRLLITAGTVLVLMLALLFVVEG
ncbi:MAG TPA: hypothetical protein VNP95_00095 [Thermomicrobiales bacterium]|nr:hypothetical protein [Thermomicrobiales bacterium]